MRLTPEEIIQDQMWAIENWPKEIPKHPPHIQASFYDGMGDSARIIALNYAILRKCEETKRWLGEAVNYYLKSEEMIRDLGELLEYAIGIYLLDCVVPLRDEELYARVSRAIEDVKRDVKPFVFEDYLHCMAPLLRGEYDEVLKRLPTYRELERKYWKEVGWYGTMADAIEALAKGDKEPFMEALHGILKTFKRRNAQLKEIPICTEATTLFILAQRRGIDISLEEIDKRYREFIPECMVER